MFKQDCYHRAPSPMRWNSCVCLIFSSMALHHAHNLEFQYPLVLLLHHHVVRVTSVFTGNCRSLPKRVGAGNYLWLRNVMWLNTNREEKRATKIRTRTSKYWISILMRIVICHHLSPPSWLRNRGMFFDLEIFMPVQVLQLGVCIISF